jgi:hypothetical protein
MDQGLRIAQEYVPPGMPGFDVLSQAQGYLLLIALLCGLSVLLILLWLLAVWEYTRTVILRRRGRLGG